MVSWKGDTPIRLTSGGESVSNGQTSSATTTVQPSITTHTQQLNDCVEVPRPQSTANDADALVFFGATGDLAYKKIFPALQRMIRKGRLKFRSSALPRLDGRWTSCVSEPATACMKHGGGVDEQAFDQLIKELRYIDGDYADPNTFKQLGNNWRAQCPGALPGDSSQHVRDGCIGTRAIRLCR